MKICPCAILLCLSQVVEILAVRDATEVDGVKLPQNCDGKGKTTKCCGCGDVLKNVGRDEAFEIASTWGFKEDVCVMTTDENAQRPCCPLWTTDCKESDPYYSYRVFQDCQPSPKECLRWECSDVWNEYEAAERDEKNFRKANKVEERWVITGQSNSDWACDCACGEVVNATSLECKSLNTKALYCSDVRPCCMKLDECKAEDPWPQAIEKNKKNVIASEDSFYGQLKAIVGRKKLLELLVEECHASCRLTRMSQCVADLKSAKKKTWMSSKSWQEAVEKERYKTSKKKGKSEMWDDQMRELDHQRNPGRRMQQLVKIKPLFSRPPPDDLLKTKKKSAKRQCCACSRFLSGFQGLNGNYPKVTSLCMTPEMVECDRYVAFNSGGKKGMSACKQMQPEFCSDASITECSSDLEHYSTFGSWEDA